MLRLKVLHQPDVVVAGGGYNRTVSAIGRWETISEHAAFEFPKRVRLTL